MNIYDEICFFFNFPKMLNVQTDISYLFYSMHKPTTAQYTVTDQCGYLLLSFLLKFLPANPIDAAIRYEFCWPLSTSSVIYATTLQITFTILVEQLK